MKKKRDPNSGALLFHRSPEENKKKLQDKYVEQMIKVNKTFTKQIKTLQTKLRSLEKRVKSLEDKKE